MRMTLLSRVALLSPSRIGSKFRLNGVSFIFYPNSMDPRSHRWPVVEEIGSQIYSFLTSSGSQFNRLQQQLPFARKIVNPEKSTTGKNENNANRVASGPEADRESADGVGTDTAPTPETVGQPPGSAGGRRSTNGTRGTAVAAGIVRATEGTGIEAKDGTIPENEKDIET